MEVVHNMQTAYNAALFILWAIFSCSMLERRFSMHASLGLGLVCFLIWFWISTTTFSGELLRVVIGVSDLILFSLLIFKSRWPRILFCDGIAAAIMLFSEIMMLLLFPSSTKWFSGIDVTVEVDLIGVAGLIVLLLIFNGLLLWLVSRIFGKYRSQLSSRDWLLFAPLFASQTGLVFAWYSLYINGAGSVESNLWIGLAITFTAVADMGLNSAMKGIAQRATLKAENSQLEKQIDTQKEHYAALTEQYENVRRMRHDIANHVQTIKILLEHGEMAEAESYTAELLPHTEYRSSLGQCENPVVDAFLYSRMEELRSQGFELTVQVVIPAYLHIANTDLVIAFGNLLDNAAEACQSLEDKRITLRASIIKGYLVIEMINPMPKENATEKKRRVPELERGVGFSILQELAQRYDGEFTSRAEDGRFIAELMLREEEENAANCRM